MDVAHCNLIGSTIETPNNTIYWNSIDIFNTFNPHSRQISAFCINSPTFQQRNIMNHLFKPLVGTITHLSFSLFWGILGGKTFLSHQSSHRAPFIYKQPFFFLHFIKAPKMAFLCQHTHPPLVGNTPMCAPIEHLNHELMDKTDITLIRMPIILLISPALRWSRPYAWGHV